jgi:hypothetical protein
LFGESDEIPDKVTAKPCIWLESVCFSSTLNGALKRRAAAAG